jgi:hypothetical protein
MDLGSEESVPIVKGTLQWLPVRQRLGISAFGSNAYRAARAGDSLVEEHEESTGQEEVYIVVRGCARFTIAAEMIDAAAGAVVFVSDPTTRRSAVALDDDTIVLAVGGWPDRPFKPAPWEPIYFAHDAMGRGAWAEAAETIEREADEEQRQTTPVLYRLACCYSRAGELDRAADELRMAFERAPDRVREWSDGDAALDPLRERDDWPL